MSYLINEHIMESEKDDSLTLIFELWKILNNDNNVMDNLAKFIDQHGEETFNKLMLSDYNDGICNFGSPLFTMLNPESR